MKQFLILILVCLSCQSLRAQDRIKDSTQFYTFEINYWFNLHHFLWMESFLNVEKDSSIITQQLSTVSRMNLDLALDYYKENLTKLDLKRSDYMTAFKSWITDQDFELTSIPPRFQEHVSALKKVSDVYKTTFWPLHKTVCEAVLKENLDLIQRTEVRYIAQIKKIVHQFWQAEPIKVDITYYGTASNWNIAQRPYTTLFPTHVVMTGIGENDVEGNWVELLFHESAHHLILSRSFFVGGTIKDVSEVLKLEPPRSFWHAYLFYFTGEVCQQLFMEEGLSYKTTYMERSGVFGRYYQLLDIHLKPYMEREITLATATSNLLLALNKQD